MKPYRVVQWATGSIGTEALKLIIDRPELELAGVLVHSPAKHGRDAGDLCGRPATGIVATNRIADILALDADVVIHSPTLDPHADQHGEVEAMLRSGKNVISHRAYIWPQGEEPELAARLQRACEAGGVSLFGAGINPGFFNDRITAGLTSACARVRGIDFGSAFDLSARSPLALRTCAIGLEMDEVTLDLPVVKSMDELYREGIHMAVVALGCHLVRVVQEVEPCPATRDILVNGLQVKKGQVGGVKWRWRAETAEGVTLRYEFRFFVDRDLPGWDTRNVRSVRIDGDPPVYAEFDVGPEMSPNAPEPYKPIMLGMAALAINAIPEVVAAPPGLMGPTIFAPWRADMLS